MAPKDRGRAYSLHPKAYIEDPDDALAQLADELTEADKFIQYRHFRRGIL